MKTKSRKMLIISIILILAVAAGAVTAFLAWPREPDARQLLSEADRLSEQNLCLTYLLKQDPTDEESWRQLLTNYAVLGADPLTLEATRQASGLELTLPEVTVVPEEPGEILGVGGIVDGKARITDYEGCGAVVSDGETVYYTTSEGIYADYHGLEVFLTPARAERMIATENGLYYLNVLARRVQYIARDGHRTETVSEIEAADFAFLEGSLWIAGRDGTLYKDGQPVEAPAVTELCAHEGVLYAACPEGLLAVGGQVEILTPVYGLVSGDRLYYLNRSGHPCAFMPGDPEIHVLKAEPVVAVGFSDGRAYYFSENRKIKKL